MGSLAEDMKKFDGTVDNIARKCVEMQITCMLLYYAGCLRRDAGDGQSAQIMFDFIAPMRDTLFSMKKRCEDAVGAQEVVEGIVRIGAKKMLYQSLSDAMISSNAEFFAVPPRPEGPEYQCDEAACRANMEAKVQKYFVLSASAA